MGGVPRRAVRALATVRVLVTGSAGFVGTELVRKLKNSGHVVVGVDVLPDRQADIALQHDLRSGPADTGPVDACVHLAAMVGGLLFNQRPELLAENALIDRYTVETCRLASCDRIIFTSSINVFEASPTFEHDVLRSDDQSTPYARAKAKAERVLAGAVRHCTILRPTNIFGRGQLRRHSAFGESHVIPDLLAKIAAGGTVTVLGDGTQVRNFVHVSDVCDFICSNLGLTGPHWLNLRSDMTITIAQLVRDLIAFTGARVDVRYDPSYMSLERAIIRDFDVSVPRAFGWAPKVRTIAEGLTL